MDPLTIIIVALAVIGALTCTHAIAYHCGALTILNENLRESQRRVSWAQINLCRAQLDHDIARQNYNNVFHNAN